MAGLERIGKSVRVHGVNTQKLNVTIRFRKEKRIQYVTLNEHYLIFLHMRCDYTWQNTMLQSPPLCCYKYPNP